MFWLPCSLACFGANVLDAGQASGFIESSSFLWHQRFELAPGVFTPGANDINWLLSRSPLPESMVGMSVLDVGTTNGAMIFECERRGAERLVAVDILDDQHFGFAALCDLLGSKAQFVQASVYELADVLNESFDFIIFWGVLYHLRHPLLGLDTVRRVSSGKVLLETAVCDSAHPNAGPLAQFHRFDDLGADASNWWSPSIAALEAWIGSAGFTLQRTIPVPDESAPERALLELIVTPGKPEYQRISYERPLRLQCLDLR